MCISAWIHTNPDYQLLHTLDYELCANYVRFKFEVTASTSLAIALAFDFPKAMIVAG